MRIAVVLPPAKTSHEIDTLRAIPGAEVLVIADPHHHPGATHPVRSWRLPFLGSPRRWAAALAWLRGLRRLDLRGVELVVSLELYSVTTRQASRVARSQRIPHLVYVTEILDSYPLYRIPPWRGNTRRTVRSLDGALCWNQAGARHAIGRGVDPARIWTTTPGVDTELFRPAAETAIRRPPVAVSVGELRADKGMRDVIAAADRAVPHLPEDFRLVLVGDGPLRDEIEEMARTRPWLEVRGRVPRDDVADELQSASVFILAPRSRWIWAEQLGFAVLEAMACGLPVVVTRCGALDEVVPDHNPKVAEGDLDALADGLVQALGPQGARWGLLNRDAVADHYTLETQGARLGEQLGRAAAHRPPRG